MNISRFVIESDQLDLDRLLKTWTWRAEGNYTLLAATKMGHLVLRDEDNKLYFLHTGDGTLELLSKNANDFAKNKLTAKQYFEIFLPELIEDLELDGIVLMKDQVYSATTLPVINDEYDRSRIACLNIYEHFQVTGEIHDQLMEMDEGTTFDIYPD